MLTENQKKYLATIPASRKIKIRPYDNRIAKIAETLISQVKKVVPELKIIFIGASALKISGQNDIDINVLAKPEDFPKYRETLSKVFGQPSQVGSSIEWTGCQDGFEITVYLTDANSPGLKEQLEIFQILRRNPRILRKYELLKESLNGKPFREYQKQKYEFYNHLLSSENVEL